MSILINFKICDNSPDCNGIKACPQNAIYFDEEKDTLVINNDLCISCNKCVKSCYVWAIKLARNAEEYAKVQKEIDDDPRDWRDLFVDRYGAVPVSNVFLLKNDEFENAVLKPNKLVALEVFNDDSIECLIKSNPIKEIFSKDIVYRKFLVDDAFMDNYQIEELPALLFFRSWEVVGKIEWFYWVDQKQELVKLIDEIICE